MSKLIDKAKSLIPNLPLIDGHLNVFFVVDNIEYEVEQFQIGFSQEVDHKGQPQCESHGGRLILTLTESMPESFYSWNIDENKFKDGRIYFTTGNSGTILNIEFFNARCINLSRTITIGKGLQTILVVSAEIVKLNGIEHNNWSV